MDNMFRAILQQPFAFIIGLIVTVGLGIVVDMRLNGILGTFRRKPPAGVTPENWEMLLEWPDTYGGTVHWLGLLERAFFFAILFFTFVGLATPSYIGVWLLFKLGCYGVAWYSFRMKERAAEMNLIDLMVIQNRHANALAMTCLFATLGNLFVAILGAVCGALAVAAYEHP